NQKVASGIGPAWMAGKLDDGATREMLDVLRQGSNEDTCDKAAALLGRGVSPQSIWDALQIAAIEIVMRQPTVPNVHAVTSANALRYAFQASGDETTRKLLLLQNCAFIPMFREAMRGKLPETRIDDVKPLAAKESAASMEDIFNDFGKDRLSAAIKIRSH